MNRVQICLLCLFRLSAAFNLQYVSLDPSPKPAFLSNATYEVIEQFMGIYRVPFIDARRKASELEILVATLRPEVQEAYQKLKCEALMDKLDEEEHSTELVEKAHYAIAHLAALKGTKKIGQNERKKRIELVFAEFNDYITEAVGRRLKKVIQETLQQITRAVLFTEKLTT